VAHNVAATHVLRAKRRRTSQLVNLDDIEIAEEGVDVGDAIDEARAMSRVTELIHRLKPIDREVIILHLEGLSREEIAEIAGLTFSNVAIKIHRIKQLLARSFGHEDQS
jgi:RNA polymerase sigma-70 factor (ECF subfamily)